MLWVAGLPIVKVFQRLFGLHPLDEDPSAWIWSFGAQLNSSDSAVRRMAAARLSELAEEVDYVGRNALSQAICVLEEAEKKEKHIRARQSMQYALQRLKSARSTLSENDPLGTTELAQTG